MSSSPGSVVPEARGALCVDRELEGVTGNETDSSPDPIGDMGAPTGVASDGSVTEMTGPTGVGIPGIEELANGGALLPS